MDIRTLLQSLLDHKVKFLIIGAWALPAYGYERMTRYIDIFIQPTRSNAKRAVEALAEVGYDGIEDIAISTILSKKILLRQYILQTDIRPSVAGVGFSTAWKNKKEIDVKGLKVFVPSLRDLIKMKRAAGRGKDLEDLRVLERIRKQAITKGKH